MLAYYSMLMAKTSGSGTAEEPAGRRGARRPFTDPFVTYAGRSDGSKKKKRILKLRNKAGMSFRISGRFGTKPFFSVQEGQKEHRTKPECLLESVGQERTRFYDSLGLL